MNNQYRCRLCLQMVSNKIDIFKDDFPKMIEILTAIKVSKTDSIPKQSCLKCARDVKAALLTRKRIIKSYKILCEELKNKQSETFAQEFCKNRPNIQLTNINVVKPVNNLIADGSNKNSIEFVCIPDQSENNLNQDILYKNNGFPEEVVEIVENDTEIKVEDTSFQDQELSSTTKLSSSETRSCPKITLDRVKPIPLRIMEIKRRIIPNNGDIIRRIKREQTSQITDKTLFSRKRKREILSCHECKVQYTHRMNFNLHMAKHRKSKCDICGKLIRSDNFKKHVAMHSSNPVVCDLCGVTCKNSDSLRGHHFYYHKCTASQYVCDQCGRGFRQKYKFLLHKKKEHGGDRNFKCETCGKAFFTNLNLNNHVNMTHKKLRPHICEYCGKAFSGKYALKTHVRQHTNEAPFACEFCSEGFRQKVSLRAHLKSKHGIEEESKFFCTQCNKGFATNYALNIHERLHLMQKCEHCSESFAEQTYLDNHVRECHNEQEQNPVVAVPVEQLEVSYVGNVEEQLLFSHESQEKTDISFGHHDDVMDLLTGGIIQ